MCLNSIWFFYKYTWFTKYFIVLSKTFLPANNEVFFLKKYLPQHNIFEAHKIFVVNNFTKMYLHKNTVFSSSNSLARAVVLISRIFTLADYKKFFSFFFFLFYHKQILLFFSFKLFYFDFLNFTTYLLEPAFYYYMQELFRFSQEKINRKKFIILLEKIFNTYKPDIIILYDYKYSSYFLKSLQMSGAPLVGFRYYDSDKTPYHYNLLLGDRGFLTKYLVLQQIFEVYTVATCYMYKMFVKRFFLTNKIFLI